MSTVLYRKYRPRKFSELKGQQTIKDILIHSINNDNFSHGYLFSGPRGTGKTTTARLFANAINDKMFKEKGDLSEYREDSIDIIEMDAASNRGIDEIRELRDNVNYLPAELGYKVYIIDEAHMLTKEAFNALLKTLEEPPKHVVFILATTEPHKIPVTILSRVTRLDFKLAESNELKEKIKNIAKEEKIKISDGAIDKLYKLSGGSFRDSESMLAKVIQSESDEITEETIDKVFGLLPEEGIINFLSSLENNDHDELSKVLMQIDDTHLDFFLEEALEYIVNNSKFESVIPLLLNIIENQKFYNNKKVYILAKLNNISNNVQAEASFNQTNKPEIQVKSQKSKVKDIEEDLQPANSIQNSDSQNSSSEDFIEALGNLIEKDDKRLGAIVKTCEFESIDSGKLILGNKYNFNIKYLNQKVNVEKIIDTAARLNSEIKGLEIASDKKKVQKKSTAPKVTIKKVEVKEEEQPKEVKTETKEKPKDESFDNSELVESIL
ncbi:DNA polymerase III subunit gamma/tau [Candidatus Dojkabacteria bacterium]|uniref:DNA polymerase III subunit gamma/tau n=1 Tax=Candidatus Dojkabacteria bacterium TaxID=2099670 RepID=A0A955LAK8_9BACT|nr:DNA polymerase III subunit gamma/tau [Candidatus Dojkabacteria bacterium]